MRQTVIAEPCGRTGCGRAGGHLRGAVPKPSGHPHSPRFLPAGFFLVRTPSFLSLPDRLREDLACGCPTHLPRANPGCQTHGPCRDFRHAAGDSLWAGRGSPADGHVYFLSVTRIWDEECVPSSAYACNAGAPADRVRPPWPPGTPTPAPATSERGLPPPSGLPQAGPLWPPDVLCRLRTALAGVPPSAGAGTGAPTGRPAAPSSSPRRAGARGKAVPLHSASHQGPQAQRLALVLVLAWSLVLCCSGLSSAGKGQAEAGRLPPPRPCWGGPPPACPQGKPDPAHWPCAQWEGSVP